MSLAVEININLDPKKMSNDLTSPDKRLLVNYKQDHQGAYKHISLDGMHNFLSDDFDLEGKYILLEDEIKVPLQNYIKNLKAATVSDIEITFLWSGYRVIKNVEITLDNFLSMIEENKILNRVCLTISN